MRSRIYFPLALAYAISYFYRNANAIIEGDLVQELGLGPADLGLLTSVYFISFAAFQLPLGILLDRYGPRRTESILLLFAALGALLFAQAESLSGLIVGRLLIGLGVSACLMAAFKAYVLWFSSERLAMINGLQMVAGNDQRFADGRRRAGCARCDNTFAECTFIYGLARSFYGTGSHHSFCFDLLMGIFTGE